MRIKDFFPYLVILVLIGVIWFRGCEREVRVIEVPGKDGEFRVDTIYRYIEQTDTVYINRWNEIEVPTTNPVNQQLLEAYKTAQDSLEQFKLYVSAIEERTFLESFSDDNISIDVGGRVRGHLLNLEVDYSIPPSQVETPLTRFRLLGGFEIGNNLHLGDFRGRGTLGLQNSKGNIFTLGYDTKETIWVGYQASLFSW